MATLTLLLCLSVGVAFASGLHDLFSEALKDHAKDGKVNYAAFGKDKRFTEYLSILKSTNPASIKSGNDRLAFWINAYNAFTIKLILDHSPVKSIRDIEVGGKGPWDIEWIEIAGSKYSLNKIEHAVIRKQFDEPRIHMALVCAAKSCPPLRSEAYEGKRLDAQLNDSAKRFLADTTRNRFDRTTNTLYLSELFSWYGEDFQKGYGSAAKFALTVMGVPYSEPLTVKYKPYNWDLNE